MVTSLLPLIRHAHLAVLAWIGCILWSLPASAGPYGCLVNSRVMYTTQSRIDVYHSNVFVAA